ncbi:MAG: type IV conjugative transfer system lipoprotein TraV [Hydrogenophilales bacterium]|nr:type IV conjugative transfer system lipoprotein TraV [Hydrogenophilales bacterium]
MSIRASIPLLMPLALVVGCASNMSGLDGSDKHSCPYSEGVTCKPMSQVYEESTQGVSATPATRVNAATPEASTMAASASLPTRGALKLPSSVDSGPVPLRSRPSVMRIWVAPWEDADGDLHEGGWIALRLDDGRWNLAHVRERIRDGYGASLVPPPATENKASTPAKPASLAADVADVLPKGLVPGTMSAPAVPFFESHTTP